jgi:hypothetical protein
LSVVRSLEELLLEGDDLVIMFGVFLSNGVAPSSSKMDEHTDVLSFVLPELCEPIGIGPKAYAGVEGVRLDGGALLSRCMLLGPGILLAIKPQAFKILQS